MIGENLSAEQRMDRARKAKEILDSEVFVDALTRLRKRIIDEWEDSESPDERLRLWAQYKATSRITEELTRTLSDGEHARIALEERNKRLRAASTPRL